MFDPVKKIVERVSNVVIEDRMDVDNQVLFPMSFEELEEVDNLIPDIASNSRDIESTSDEEKDHEIELDEEVSVSEEKRSRGRPVGSKSNQKPTPVSDRVLRDRQKKTAHIAALKVSLDPVSYEDTISRSE